jgi:iron complex outermembrane recepter protein
MLQIAFRRICPLLLITWSLTAHSQGCSDVLQGLVEDNDGEMLVGATIWIASMQRGTSSDYNGKFILTGLCPGSYDILVKYVGFEDQRMFVRIPNSRSLVVKLKPSTRVLHDIVIEGNHSEKHSLSQSLSILSDEQLAATKGKPIGEMLQQIPGVQSIMTGAAIFKPVIHGLYGQRIMMLNNGLRQEGQQWGIEHAPEIDTYMASEIEVVKGSEAVRYGSDALGGVIIINAQPLHYLTSIGADLNTAFSSNNRLGAFSGMLEGGFSSKSDWGWRIQGTVKKGGDYHAPNYNLSNTGLEEFDISTTLGFKKEKKELELFASSYNTTIGILRSAHTGNLSDLQESITSRRPWYVQNFTFDISNPRQEIGHHLLKISGKFGLKNNSSIKLMYGGQYNRRKEYDVRRGNQNVPSLSFDLITQTLDVSYDHEKNLRTGSVGISGALKNNYNERTSGLLPDYTQYNIGVFLVEKIRKDKWLFEGGIRLDRQFLSVYLLDKAIFLRPEFTFYYPALSLGSSLYLNSNSRISSNLGIANRPPHVSELYSRGLHHSAASIEQGLMTRNGELQIDPSGILKERSYQWVSTFQHNKKNFSLELTGYVNYFRNFIFLAPASTQLTIRGYFPVFQYRQTNALLSGIDLFLSYDLNQHFTYSTKFALVRAEDRGDGNKLPFIPPAQLDNTISYKKEAIGKWKNLVLSFTSQIGFKQTRAPEAIYPEDVPSDLQNKTFDFMPAPETFFLHKVDVGAKLPLDNRDLTITFAVENIFNEVYRNYMNRLRYYADEAGRNFSLRVNYTFHSHQ